MLIIEKKFFYIFMPSRYYITFVLTLFGLIHAITLYADPFPPYWKNGTGSAIHYAPINWPGDLQWNVYTLNGISIHDQRDNDPSNGGTSPQNYVNVSSGCVDLQEPSVYWWFDHTSNMICFRWRVEQIANTYAVGPKAGAFSSSDPWGSALWTVFFDIDGDGFREFAMFLNGSSGSPSEPVDIIVSVYSDTQSQSLDWETSGIYQLFHNPTAFVDAKSKIILNFQSSLTPIASWPNGKNETVWDYGSTRAVALDGCGEYFIDYQIPLDMFDATHVGGPKLTTTTPFAMLFATANSLNNPLQKDLVYVGELVGDPTKKASFGDMITFATGPVVQPFVILIEAEGCQPINIVAYIRDAFDCTTGTCVSSVVDAKFYGYLDANQNGLPDDNSEWLYLLPGVHSETIAEKWTASWDSASFAAGQYLIGAKGTDVDGNTTWGFLSETEVSNMMGGSPNYANISPDPGVAYAVIKNDCGGVQKNADLSIQKTVNLSAATPGDTLQYQIVLTNNGPMDATQITVQDALSENLIFLSSSSANYSSTSGVWSIPLLSFNESISLDIQAKIVDSPSSLSIVNTAFIIMLAETDTETSNNSTSAQTSISTQDISADLSIEKISDKSLLLSDDIVCYTLSATNIGPDEVPDISVVDNLPETLIYINHMTSQGDFYPYSKLWLIGKLSANQTEIMTLCARLTNSTLDEQIINRAQIFSSTINDPYLTNNQSESTGTRIGLVFRPDNEMTTANDSVVIFSHDISIATGGQTGILSLDIDSSQNLSWSVFYDSNSNSVLDVNDTQWTQPQSVSSRTGTLFFRSYIGNDIPKGWLDSTVVQANLMVSNQTMTQTITDITRVIESIEGAAISLNFVPLNSASFSASTCQFIEFQLNIQNTANEPLNDITINVQWDDNFSSPAILSESQVDSQIFDNSIQSIISSLSELSSKILAFKLLLIDCSSPHITATASFDTTSIEKTQLIDCTTFPPEIEIQTVIPEAIKNDPSGQTYEINISNTGGITKDMTIKLDIPEGFFLLQNTVFNNGQHNMTVVPGDPATLSFDSFSLCTDETIQVKFNLGTTCDVVIGTHPLIITIIYNDADDITYENEIVDLIHLPAGLIVLDLSPVSPIPFAIEPGNRITVKGTLTNNGQGVLNFIDIRAEWGIGLSNPTLGDNNITPVLNDRQYQYISDIIPAQKSIFFEFSLDVISCENLTIDIKAFDPCDSSTIFTDDSSPFLILKQPNMNMSASDTSIRYCGSGTIQVNLENVDNPVDTRGLAQNFFLTTNIPENVRVSNVSEGWVYDNAVFSFPGGKINAGQNTIMTFDITPEAPCNAVSGTLIFSPLYENTCGDLFAPPLFMASYQMGEQPTIGLNTTMFATGNDSERLFLDEPVIFTISPQLTQPENWNDNIVIQNILSNAFIIQDISVTHGTFEQNNNQLTWSLSPHTVTSSPILTIQTITTSDPCEAGKYIGNKAVIDQMETSCGCIHSASSDVGGYLQNKGDSLIEALTEIRSITNLPTQGSYDVCSDRVVRYQLHYMFDSSNTGVWKDSYFKDMLDCMQSYVDGSAMYRINENSPWISIDSQNITIQNGLIIELSFMTDVYNGYTSVSNRLIDLQYDLKPSPQCIDSCTPSKHIVSQSDLYISKSPVGCDRGDLNGKHFYQMVKVPVSRAVMDVNVNLNTNAVSKGQRIQPTISIDKVTPWPTHEVQLEIDTSHYYVHQPLTFTGFGGKIPDISIQDNSVRLTFHESLLEGESGVIHFDASKKCSDDYHLSAALTYKDSCGNICNAQNSDQPVFKLQGNLIMNLTPDQVMVNSAVKLQWTVYVTNKGTGTAYNIRLKNNLKNIFEYIQTQVNNEITAVNIEAIDNDTNSITLDLASLAPNEVHEIEFTVNTSGIGCDLLDTNSIELSYGWIDDQQHYYNCENIQKKNTPIFSMPPSLIWMSDSVLIPPSMCGVATLSLELANTGMTHNYNISITQHLLETGFTYIPGTATINGIPIHDPIIDNTDLIWTFDSNQSNHVQALEDLDIGQRHTIAMEVNVPEASFTYKVVSASVSWQKPCERNGTITTGSFAGAAYAVPVQFPVIDIEILGWNQTAGQTESNAAKTIYGGFQDTVIWKVMIYNSGDADARAMILDNLLSDNVLFNAVAIDSDFANPQVINDQSNITVYPDDTVANNSQTFYFRSVVQDKCNDVNHTATAEWGCPDDPTTGDKGGITSPNDNSDVAYLKTMPSISQLNIQQEITTPGTHDSPVTNGRIVLTIKNKGGTSRNIVITDELPENFILDTTTPPTVSSNLNHLSYAEISGTPNRVILSLLSHSSSTNSTNPHDNILRYDETVEITFYIVRNHSIDDQYDVDVRQEKSSNGNDPGTFTELTNLVTVIYENSCGVQQDPVNHETSFVPKAIDLDIDIANPIDRIVNNTGDDQKFMVIVYNRGKIDSFNASVTVDIGNSWSGELPDGCSGDIPGTVICNIDSLASGKQWRKTFSLNVARESDLTFLATVTGDIHASDGTSTHLTWAKDAIRSRVIGFRIERDLIQTTENDSSDNELLIGEDAVVQTSAIVFGLQGNEPITNLTLQDTFDNGLGFMADTIHQTPGNIDLSIHTVPDAGESGTIVWKLDSIDTSGSFVVDHRIRLNNNSLNNEAAPNVHNATLLDQTDVSFVYLGKTFNNNTNGFPGNTDCQTEFTVQTPRLTLSKKVKNMTQSHETYSESVNIHAGDILEYQLTIVNEADRGPAFDIIITDNLPDKLILIPFASDSIDNDGDGEIDETIDGIDNGGGNAASIQFDSTHSNALTVIRSEEQAVLTYRVRVDNGVNPSEIIQNTAQLVCDTLPGESGSQLPEQGENGTSNGSRQYQWTDNASVYVDSINTTSSKTIIHLSSTPPDGHLPFGGPQHTTIGEKITFELTFSVVPSSLSEWQLLDQMPTGMLCISSEAVTLSTALFSPGGIISPTISPDGSQVIWHFGDQTILPESGIQTISAKCMVQIQNTENNQAGRELINRTAEVSYQLNDTAQTIALDDVTMVIHEPQLTITKTFRNITKNDPDDYSQFTPPDAGDIIEYRVKVINESVNAYTACDISIYDQLSEGQTFVSGSTSGGILIDPDITGTGFVKDAQALLWGRDQSTPLSVDISASDQLVFFYQVEILNDVMPFQALTNAITIDWTSLKGSISGERNGTGGINDYIVSDETQIVVPDSNTIQKIRWDDSFGSDDFQVRVGDIVTWKLSMSFQEGTFNNVVIADTLPEGFSFIDTLSIADDTEPPFVSSGNINYDPVTETQIPFIGDTQTIEWQIGTVVNAGDNETPDIINITYRTLITDSASILQTPGIQNIKNVGSLNYVQYDQTFTDSKTSEATIVLGQPELEITKQLLSPDSPFVSPGDYVEYRLELSNKGGAPAYNAEFRDILPENMTPVQIIQSILNGTNTVVNYLTPSTDKTLVWKLANDQSILPGQSLQIDIQVQVDPLLSAHALQMDNKAIIDRYFGKPSDDLIQRRQYPNARLLTPVSVFIPGISISPNHTLTSIPGTSVVFEHRLNVFTGDTTGKLSFSIDSQHDLTWVLYMDTNNNNEYDAQDQQWINGDTISTTIMGIYLKTVLPDYLPSGWKDQMILTASLTIGDKVFSRNITDIIDVLISKSGEMQGIKEVAIDANCNTQLEDETPDHQRFEKAKSIAPGECAIYRIQFINTGSGDLSNIEVNDMPPHYSTYIWGSATVLSVPDSLTPGKIVSPDNDGSGKIAWPFSGKLKSGQRGMVQYEVQIDE